PPSAPPHGLAATCRPRTRRAKRRRSNEQGPLREELSAERAVETPRSAASKNASRARRTTAGAGGPRGACPETTAGDAFFRGGLVGTRSRRLGRCYEISSVVLMPAPRWPNQPR